MAPTRDEQHWMYRNMVTSRKFEETIAGIYFEGKTPVFSMADGPIPGEMHLSDGQEPVAVGVCAHLTSEDVVTATHRPHHQAIAKGVDLDKMAAEIFGKATGLSGGRGGHMHLFDPDVNFACSGIIAQGMGPAVGAALSRKMQKKPGVGVAFVGEGAVNQGGWHEAMNLAATWKLPFVCVIEDNDWGISVSKEDSTAISNNADRAAAARRRADSRVRIRGGPTMNVPNERKLTIARAMAEAVQQEMQIDPSVFVMGEDIGALGGVYGNTRGLLEEFGPERIRDTPISETAFIGAAVGAAQDGMRPVVELMFVDFFGVCFDAIYNLMAKNIYFSGGNVKVPMVLMTSTGGGYSDGGQHSQCLYGTFAHLPGMKVVCPSNAYDAKGLMTAAMRDDSPVVYMYHKSLQGMGWLATEPGATVHTPEESYTLDIGKAKVARQGSDVTIVSVGLGVHHALKAAEQLEADGASAEVIDLVSLVPLDRDTIRASVAKTGRLIVVDEDYMSYGVSGEVIASVTEHDISVLKAAPKRVAYPDVPIPYARVMEQFCLPNPDKIVAAFQDMKAA